MEVKKVFFTPTIHNNDGNYLILLKFVFWHHFLTPVAYIVYRLNSGRESYITNGGKLGRKKDCIKTTEQKKEEYKEVISFLKRGYSVRNTATLCFHEPTTTRYFLCTHLIVAFKCKR